MHGDDDANYDSDVDDDIA